MKKKSIFLSALIVFMGVNLLASCKNDAPTDGDNITESTVGDKEEEKKAPVFQGITIKKMDSIQLNRFDTTGSVITRDNSEKGDDHDNGWHGRNPKRNGNGNGNSDDDYLPEDYDTPEYDQDIEDLMDLEVITDDEVKYFVQAEEEFLVLIKLKNPSNYEIQSFTLNGKKYSNYMFEDGSDMENLYLKVKAPKEGGYTEYSIDSIKYIDGTEIKDVDLSSGNKSIKAGVKYENEPQINVTNLDSGINEVSFNLYLTDTDNLITEDAVLYISDGEEIVGQKNLKVGNNFITLGSLRFDRPYQYIVVAKYDACDGKELCNHILYKGDFATKALMSFKDINISNQGVSFDVEAINDSVALTYAGVFDKGNENRVFKYMEEFDNLSFDGLNSNHSYILYLEYTFLVEGESYIGYIFYDFNTDEMEEPKVAFNTILSTKDSISFDYSIVDNYNVLTIDNVELYLGEEKVASLINGEKEFKNLLSNKEYLLVLNYSYDLNDGLGRITKSISIEKNTLAKVMPSIGIKITSITDSHVIGDVIVSDSDNLANVEALELYKGDNLEAVSYEKSFDFSISSNSNYTLKIKYTYDLNDGEGIKEAEYIYDLRTNKRVPNVELYITDVKDTSMTFDVIEVDENNVGSVSLIKLLKDGVLVKNVPLTNYTIDDLIPSSEYELIVTYTYDLDNGEGAKSFDRTASFKTWNQAPSIDLDLQANENQVEYSLNYEDVSNTFELKSVSIRKNGVSIESLNTLQGTFDGLLSNNEYSILVKYSYKINDDEEKILSYEKTLKTKEKEAPQVGIIIDEITVENIKGEVSLFDPDNLCNIISCGLYQGDTVVAIDTSLDFNYAVSANTSYQIIVKYSYDLNDGLGKITKSITKEVTTSKGVPVIKINEYNVSQNSFEFSLDINDINARGNLSSYNLYKDNNYIQSINRFDTQINNLEANSNYRIVVIYRYDLDDGTGAKDLVYNYDFKTLKTEPSFTLIENEVKTDSASINYNISDIDQALTFKKVSLRKDGEIVQAFDEETRSFDQLLSNTYYTIVAEYEMDLNNGPINVSRNLTIKTLAKQTPIVNMNLSSTKNSVTYSYELFDQDNISALKSIELYLDGVKVDSVSSNNTFEDLLSNREYEVRITLECDYNDGLGKVDKVYSKTVHTISKAEPSGILTLNQTKTSISYNFEKEDIDGVVVNQRVELYIDNVKQNKIDINNEFTGLFSNVEYEVRVILECDYNDGNGIIEQVYSNTITTDALQAPTLDFNFTSTKDEIQAELDTLDRDNILSIYRIEVYDNNSLVATITDFDNIFVDDLTSNKVYTFKAYYSYDLNDGTGVIDKVYQESYSTLAYDVQVDSLTILNEDSIKTDEIINVRANLNNLSNIRIESIYVNNVEVEIVGGDYTSFIIFAIKAPNMSGDFTISASKFGYTLNEISVVQDIDEAKITIPVASRLSVVKIATFDGSDIVNGENPAGTVITVDNPDGYEVVGCTISKTNYYGSKEFETSVIDNNHFYISLNNNSSGRQNYKIESITYLINGERVVRNYNDTFTVSATYIKPSESYGIVIKKISTPEDLLNIESGNSYEIVNDIDMTGYNWSMKNFDGYINGNGHTISNISMIIENEYTYSQNYALFNSLRGTIKNLFFKNVYYGIQSKGDITCDVLAISNSAETTGVLISGSVNIDSPSYDVTNNKQFDIVDHYYVNTQKFFESNTITNERFESEEYRNEIGWVFVEKEINEYNGFEYKIIDNSYIFIDSYNGSESIVSIPTEINGLPVRGVSDYAFANNKSIVDITIPKEIIFVGGDCLSGCSNIEKISFGNCNFEYLFGDVEYENSVKYDFHSCYLPRRLKEIVITRPEGVSYLGNITSLEKVVLPEGLTELCSNMFSGCEKLKDIHLPDSLMCIGNCAFDNCISLISIEIPDSVTSIGLGTFQNCSQLTSIVIPEGVTSIGSSTFICCGSLTSVVIPEGVTSIGERAFAICNKLHIVSLPRTLESLGEQIIDYSLDAIYYSGTEEEWQNISIGSNNNAINSSFVIYNTPVTSIELKNNGTFKYFEVSNGDVYIQELLDKNIESIDLSEMFNGYTIKKLSDGLFRDCSKLTSIIIPEGVTSIGSSAFQNCSKLTSIVIPESVTSIGSSAFYNCSQLTSIVIPESVTSIGADAFEHCSQLTSIVIPEGVTSIGAQAFVDCYKLHIVSLPRTLESVGENIINYPLDAIYYSGAEEEWKNISIGSSNDVIDSSFVIYNTPVTSIELKSNNLFTYYEVSNGDVYIQELLDKNIESIDLSEMFNGYTIKKLSGGLFRDCSKLTSIIIPEGVTSIGSSAFYNCSQLTSIVIPEGITSIGSHAFDCCYQLTSIVIPESVTSIGSAAFQNCSQLTSIVIPEGVTSIGSCAFRNCSQLTSIVIPEGVTSIGDEVFVDCYILHIVSLPRTLESVGEQIINYSLDAIYYSGTEEEWQNISIGNNNNAINSSFVIYNTPVTSIVLKNNRTFKYYEVNNGDVYIQKLLDKNIESIDLSEMFNEYTIKKLSDGSFIDCGKLTSIVIPEGVTSIGSSAFYNCNQLTSIVIPEGITWISNSTFYNCNNLESVSLPSTLEGIADEAFYGCSQLTSVIIPEGVESIGNNAFDGCGLSMVVLPKSVTALGVQVFNSPDIYYEGSMEDWQIVEEGIDYNVGTPFDGTLYYYSEEEPTDSGNYWHYVDGLPVKWE